MPVISNFPAVQGKVAVFAHDEGLRGTTLVIPSMFGHRKLLVWNHFYQIHPLNQFTCIV
jgi:hypothetical protein